jgi:gag-polypeptide of LTR copia-type
MEFTSIVNDLDKLGVKIENEDQALLLLCLLSASYKAFRDMMGIVEKRLSLRT